MAVTPDEFSLKAKVSVGLVVFLVMGGFAVGGAYYKSSADKAEIKREIGDINQRLVWTHERMSRKFDRVEASEADHEKRIRELEIKQGRCDAR